MEGGANRAVCVVRCDGKAQKGAVSEGLGMGAESLPVLTIGAEKPAQHVTLTGQPQPMLWKRGGEIWTVGQGLRRVIDLLRPFDLSVVVHDPYLDPAEAAAMGLHNLPLDEVIARADVLSLHAPALEATRHMIDARRLALLRDGATLINTARGSLIDQAALTRELVSGRISAVIDVTEPEVLPKASPLYDLPNVLLTPHIAGAVGRERERLGAMAVAEVERFLTGQPLAHQVAAATLHLQA